MSRARSEPCARDGAHRVAVVVLPGVRPLDLGIPAQVFTARPGSPYSVSLCAARPGPVASSAGFDVLVEHGLEVVAGCDTVLVPGYDTAQPPPQEVLEVLRTAHAAGRRVVSICTGAFALAAAGVLDGLRATTHWDSAERLARMHPSVEVDADALYVDQGSVLTSAGVSAGIDLCLHLVRRDRGAAAANALARALVAAPHREGGQRQYVEHPVAVSSRTSLGQVRERAVQQLAQPLTVAEMAGWAHLSPRTFARRFLAETATTPKQWLLSVRIQRARELLETSDLGVDRVASAVGLGTVANFRAHFRRATGRTPAAYRSSFNATAAVDGR
ncbi:GlxA family transcriptional regulator [Kineococcus esterisolvens]|uniref:GlxA family transcriptional regulator n=1 Tax=unclassified Kineococcus TaxID=2621656 RepID=UPI003D7DAA13